MDPVLLTRSGPDIPWGFRLSGGADQQKPLTVQRVTPGSIAAQGLVIGDLILRVGNRDASGLSYADAMETIKTSGDRLELYTGRSNSATQPREEFSNTASPSYITNDVHQSPDLNSNHHHHHRHSPQRQGESDHGSRDPKSEGHSGQHKAPEAVLNIAARTTEDKRPFTYAPDIQSLQQQRIRVQRRNYEPTKSAAPSQRCADPPHSPQVQVPRPLPQTTSQTQGGELENGGPGNYQPIYGGPEIPSRTFQMLQSHTSNSNEPGITDLARAAQRRQKRREKLHYSGSGSGGSDEVAKQPQFDEAAYLAGQISVLGQKSPVSTPSYRNTRMEQKQEEEEEERNDDKPFDERAYLAGRIPLVKGGPIDPNLFDLPPSSSSGGKEEGKDETDERDDENKKPFDERAYLAGRIPLVKGGTIDPTQFNVPERRAIRRHREPNRPRLKQPFNEGEYLAGKLNILGQAPEKHRNVPSRLPSGSGNGSGGGRGAEAKPSWYKRDEDMVSEDEYDEEAFLRGKFSIVRRSVDRELPLRKVVLERSKFARERASWQRENQEEENGRGGTCSETEFDERAFLAGRSGRRIATEKEYSTDTEADLPTKTLRILRRSVSSERSADEYTGKGWHSSNEGGVSGDETGSDQEKPYNVYMYQGRDIPSKIFSRLKKTMDRKEAAERSKIRPLDPIERLKKKSLENLGIDVDTAMERLEIGKHDPDTYMEILKKSVEENIRIEADNEVTDF